MKVVVTGSGGFIGKHLCKALQDKGWSVTEVDTKIGIDIADTQKLIKLFEGAEIVFHLAALPSVPYSIEHPQETNVVNFEGTLSVLEAARQAKVKRVVFSSSSAIYGNQEQFPIEETLSARPGSPYALQKYGGERYCTLYTTLYGLETVSLRYFNVYGPGARSEGAYAPAIAVFLKQRAASQPITVTGDGEQTRDFVHVRDVMRANMLAAMSEKVGKGETINVGTGSEVSMNRIAALVGGEITHVDPRAEPRRSLADISRAKTLLGWSPEVSLEVGVAELKKTAGLV